MTGGGCTHGLSSPVGEVLPKQQTQLSGDSHTDVFPTSLRTLQLLAVEPNRKICRSATEITNVSPATVKNQHSSLQAKLCDYIRVWNKGQKSNINAGQQSKDKDNFSIAVQQIKRVKKLHLMKQTGQADRETSGSPQ